jgi:hypothetical protein
MDSKMKIRIHVCDFCYFNWSKENFIAFKLRSVND